MQVRSLGCEDPLEEEVATHSGIPAWRMPWTEEPDGLQSVGSQRVKQLSIPAQGNSGQHMSQVQEWGEEPLIAPVLCLGQPAVMSS